MNEKRMARLFKLVEDANFKTVVLNPGPTMTYLTGFHFGLDERPKMLFLGKDIEPVLILPEFEAGLLDNAPFKVKSFFYGENPDQWKEVFKGACDYLQLDGQTVGVEPLQLRVLELFYLQGAAPRSDLVSASAQLNFLRMQKDEEEIAAMRKAVRIAENAFQSTLSSIKVGVTEREVASELVVQLLQHGSDTRIAFSPIVASGPNSANPHATPTDRYFSHGDVVVVDWGATYNGYCSDITRTLAIGRVSPEIEEIANIVAKANKRGRFSAKVGATAADVDNSTREVIDEAGYGENFIHRTGHGIGMEVHEPPYIISENPLTLEEGYTFTVEPGIYIPGRAGIRIEDNVVVRKDGGESLTDLPRDLVTIY